MFENNRFLNSNEFLIDNLFFSEPVMITRYHTSIFHKSFFYKFMLSKFYSVDHHLCVSPALIFSKRPNVQYHLQSWAQNKGVSPNR